MQRSILAGLIVIFFLALPMTETAPAQQPPQPDPAARLKVPPGFVVEVVAGPPLVHYPMMANFDERGWLFVAESSGLNLKAAELLQELPNKVLLLEGMDAKGRFTKSRVFADKMTFPSGALWHQNALYVTAAPHIWKLTERPGPKGPGIERVELVSKFNFIGNAADVHGPFLGPDGRIYWCDGRHGHEIKRPDGSISKGKAARIFRCKADGSDVEVVCGGGMDNPVEIAFTDEGEPLVTVDILHNLPSRNDGIIFAIEGGNYPWHEVSKEFPRTGDLLPAIENLGWVAPSGIMRYRGRAFGDEYRNNLFTAQFNRHRIQRHVLERKGAGFVCKTEDFLTTDDKNFHPTDVFEDADGSLLVIDTGGWFRIGCPTSQIARPEIKGAIYRIRKADMKPMDDERVAESRFSRWDWAKRGERDIIRAMFYFGPAVRDHGIEELARRGKSVLPALQQTIERNPNTIHFIRDSVWIATRIDEPEARQFVRSFVNDKELSVKLAALHSVGLHRDARALPSLLKIVAKDHPAAQRQAATALGRIKHPDAIAPIMEAIPEAGDRFLEHALIYAVIQIGHRDKTAACLNDRHPLIRRAALIALDQMPSGNLTREELAAQLNSDNKALTRAALDIVASRPKWAGEIVGLLRDWLAERDAISHENLRGLLLALANEPAIQDLMVKSMRDPKTARATRLLVIETMGRATIAKLPASWLDALGTSLDQGDDALVQHAIGAIRTRNLAQFDARLERIVRDAKRSSDTRVRAFAAFAPRVQVGDADFGFMMDQLKADGPPLLRLAAAKGLSQAKLDGAQLQKLTRTIPTAGPLELPILVGAFEKNTSPVVGLALLTALEKSPSLTSLTSGAVGKALQHVPDDARYRVQDLAKRLNVDAAKQKARLDELQPLTSGGSVEQGRDIYFGNKAACSTCHAINNKGGGVGPDLGKIGAIRSGRDLLESIVFPSASFARGFEPYVVETKAGKTHSGILSRESTDAVYLMTTERVEIRIGRDEIETFAPGRVSIMPQGLDAQLTRRALQDLLAYLQSLR
ncbi:MAG: HEAT repeat domain-containing protein [Planctomycetes bacterium]|nr:HEAT repeat domain-containing protein [Planctomycetota bacterium]